MKWLTIVAFPCIQHRGKVIDKVRRMAKDFAAPLYLVPLPVIDLVGADPGPAHATYELCSVKSCPVPQISESWYIFGVS